jgi:purine nucleosidase
MPDRALRMPSQRLVIAVLLTAFSLLSHAINARAQTTKQLVILDSDIGDDIDDAFALALAENSPEFQILGVTTAFGDTSLRAQLAVRFLAATGHANIPVAAGVPTQPRTKFTQAKYAAAGDKNKILPRSGPDFLLEQIRKYPNQITLIAIGPLTNLAAAIDKDSATFRRLKRIVMMGGSVNSGYDHNPHPDAEWNIVCDIPAAKKAFASGVPLYIMPLDSTILKMDEQKRDRLFAQSNALSTALQELYREWAQPTPTLFDAMAVAYAVEPSLCPTTPLHLTIDDKGFTRRGAGPPNVNACLHSNEADFFHFYLSRTAPEHSQPAALRK